MSHRFAQNVTAALREVVQSALPGATLISVEPLAPDRAEGGEGTAKGSGYGVPLRLVVQDEHGERQTLVFHTATPDVFGHDRRADRAQEMLLAFDTFASVPRHVVAVDVGAVKADGSGLVSLGGTSEFYLLTAYAEGHVYAEELRRIAHAGRLEPSDRAHADALVRYLVELHSRRFDDGYHRYVRALRDLVGSGEGIAGIVDGYPDGVAGAPRERLQEIERRALEWRFRLRPKAHRLARVHGDYHPFNVVFGSGSDFALLDAARGSVGDPADDVTCMAINYVFFAVETPGAWKKALGELWHHFWRTYLEATDDQELLEVAAPFLAWRGLVVCNPVWYPRVDGAARDRVLRLIERTLDASRFDPDFAEALFA